MPVTDTHEQPYWQGRTVLITGGAGFIGTALCRHLRALGATVRSLDLRGGPLPDCTYIRGSITDDDTVLAASADCDTVFHLAARVADWGPDHWFTRLNVEGTAIVLEAARRNGCRRFVQMSSVAVLDYHRQWFDAPEEEIPQGPAMGAYGRSKRRAEELVREAHHGSLQTTIIRPGMVPFGSGDHTSFAPMARAIAKRIPVLLNGGEAVFCTAWAPELARGLALAAAKPAGAGTLFHIGDRSRLHWYEWVQKVAFRLQVKPNLRAFPARPLIPLALVLETASRLTGWRYEPPVTRYRLAAGSCNAHFSMDRAEKILGFVSQTDIETALDETVAWFVESEKNRLQLRGA